ncbi:MAG: hypothetical protein LBF05_06350 [Tannerella sp.]|nr:hypothetical protein [Tannerella sp.]
MTNSESAAARAAAQFVFALAKVLFAFVMTRGAGEDPGLPRRYAPRNDGELITRYRR